MSLPISDFEGLSLNTAIKDWTSVSDAAADNFLEGYENPVAWFKKYNVQRDDIYEDIMSDNLNMKKVIFEEYNFLNMPEWIKWEQFGCNMFICYEYTCKGETDKALQVISDVENILTSIGIGDPFLNSIKIALNHITFSFKGHLLQLCSLETSVLSGSFAMPNEMDQVNKAALFGAQSSFFFEYGLPCARIAKDSARCAISLNEREAEWHYLLAKVFSHWQQMFCQFNLVAEEETDAAEKAVELGKNDQHKLYLAHVYQRMSRYSAKNDEEKQHFENAGKELVKEVLTNDTNDYLTLRNCLRRLVKLSYKDKSDKTNDMLKRLVNKLKSSNNPYVHAAIGNYYLFREENYKEANFYLKKAFAVKHFGNSLDYVLTCYKIDPNTTQIEPLYVEMLKTFPHPFQLVTILGDFISYLIVIKNKVIQALNYIPQLLELKHVDCVREVQKFRMKFCPPSKYPMNFINMLTEKLFETSMDPTLPADLTKRATEVLQMLESYKQFVSRLMQEKKLAFGNNNLKKGVFANGNNPFARNKKEFSGHTNPKQDSTSASRGDKGNWRSLKPDSVTNPNIFSRNKYQK